MPLLYVRERRARLALAIITVSPPRPTAIILADRARRRRYHFPPRQTSRPRNLYLLPFMKLGIPCGVAIQTSSVWDLVRRCATEREGAIFAHRRAGFLGRATTIIRAVADDSVQRGSEALPAEGGVCGFS